MIYQTKNIQFIDQILSQTHPHLTKYLLKTNLNEKAVPYLIKKLNEYNDILSKESNNFDSKPFREKRNNVLTMIESLGPLAKDAVPSLINSLKSEPVNDLGIIFALNSIGSPHAKPALPKLKEVLNTLKEEYKNTSALGILVYYNDLKNLIEKLSA
jgi:hypothetical protein